MGSKSFVYTYEFLRGVLRARQGVGDLDVRAFNEMLDHIDEAEKCEIPASNVANLMKKMGWVHLVLDEHGEVTEVDENA
jgi:hypothetical protein